MWLGLRKGEAEEIISKILFLIAMAGVALITLAYVVSYFISNYRDMPLPLYDPSISCISAITKSIFSNWFLIIIFVIAGLLQAKDYFQDDDWDDE